MEESEIRKLLKQMQEDANGMGERVESIVARKVNRDRGNRLGTGYRKKMCH